MNPDELIAKQQIEIEELKMQVTEYKTACKDALAHLWRPEQWNMHSPGFPKVAMTGICQARDAISGICE